MHILQSTMATSVYATEMIYAFSRKRKNDQQFQLQTGVQFCFIFIWRVYADLIFHEPPHFGIYIHAIYTWSLSNIIQFYAVPLNILT